MKHMAADFANVRPIDMDADRGLVGKGVPHAVHIADGGRHGFYIASF